MHPDYPGDFVQAFHELSGAEGPESSGQRFFHSIDLFRDRKEIHIRHKNQDYRLLITKAGKLILNK